jgi:hypothetical protein
MSGFRCKECGHKPKRIVSATVQTKGADPKPFTPRVRKKTCDCVCHRQADAA